MVEVTAVILAAGMGVRMGPRGRLMPKGLIPMGGAPMIQQSVAALRARGIAKIIVVTGHLAEQYHAMFDNTDVELVHNPDYADTGSLLSLAVGLERVQTACLLVEGDLIYAPQALDPMDGMTDRFLVSGPTGAGDEQYVWVKSGDARHLVQISKNPELRPEPHLGEMVGLTALTAETVPLMRRVARQILNVAPSEHYEPGLVELARRVPLECALIPDLPWAEVDDESMLERAERLVYPRIVAARS